MHGLCRLLSLLLVLTSALHAEKLEMFTRSFKVQPAFLPQSDLESKPGDDPFGPEPVQNKPLKQRLEEAGIRFPTGSSVSRGPNGEIVCRNTEENLELLRKHIDTVNATGTTSPSKAAPSQITRTFKVPPDFLAWGPASKTTSSATAADPFAADAAPATSLSDDTPPTHPTSARQTLEAAGVTFPAGASASFNPFTGILTVTNSQENLDLVEVYTQALRKQEAATIAFTLTVIEGPGDLIRKANAAASKATNASKQLAELLDQTKQPGSNVRVVGDAFLETKSGTRATLEAVCEHNHAALFTLDAKSRASITREMRQTGLRFEVEPIVSADGDIIETSFNLELIATPPAKRQLSVSAPITAHEAAFPVTDFSASQFNTSINFFIGHTHLIGITKPLGTAQESTDTLRAAFLTATLRHAEALPLSQPRVAAPSSVPDGMIFAALPAPDVFSGPAMAGPKGIALQAWLINQGVTFPSGSSLEHRDDTLRCVNTLDNIALIAAIAEREVNLKPATVALTLHTVEASATFLRDLTRQTLSSADDSGMFAAVEAAVARGDATFINSTFFETKSGTHATRHAVREHSYLNGFVTDAQGRPRLTFASRLVGSIFDIEPTVGADARTIEFPFTHELHSTPPLIHHAHFRDPATQQPFEIPLTDFNIHKTLTTLSLTKGGTKLLSLNPPTGRDKADVLWATFLKCDVVPQVPLKPRAVFELPKPPAPQKPHSDKQITRAFRVNASDMQKWLEPGPGKEHHKSPKQLFEEAGITFPGGASVSYAGVTSQIIVRNTPENLDLVEAFISGLDDGPRYSTVAFTTHVLQGPGPLLRRLTAQAASKSNHRAELDELLAAVKTDTVQHLNTARIEAKSGTRANSTQAHENIFIADVSVNEKGESYFSQEMRQVGLRVELEPTLGTDGSTINLTLSPEFHTAPPLEHREYLIDTQGRRLEFPLTDYFTSKLTTAITIPSGTARLLSLYKPTGKPEFEKEDILQAIFITCDILRAGE